MPAVRNMINLARDLMPPLLFRWLSRLIRRRKRIRFEGDFDSWEAAMACCSGYDDDQILQRVKAAVDRVIAGEAAYERDSVLFYEKDYRWPLLALLHYIANDQRQLRVIDFGGSLGSTYFQHKDMLNIQGAFCWHIVEQASFVACGRAHYEDDCLRFFANLDELGEAGSNYSVVLFNCVLQYLPDPQEILALVAEKKVPYILIDRLALSRNDQQRLTVQHVPETIYSASYPAWFFSETSLLGQLKTLGYETVVRFGCSDHLNDWSCFQGYLFRRASE